MRAPLLVVTSVDPVAMDTTVMSLAWDLPRAVSVRHRIDPHSQLLTRTVSDADGLAEQAQTQLEHACVSCALREDIVPTLERLARDGRWSSIVAGLPTATGAGQLARILSTDARLTRRLKLSSVIAAVGCSDVVRDLLSDDLLRERGIPTNPDDGRGVGEVACAQIEFADLVVLDADSGAQGMDLVRALSRPGVPLVTGADRSRGSFWVPTRPGDLLEWSGAGGQLSIGSYRRWGRRTPVTRLVFTGLGAAPTDLAAAFENLLLTPEEALLDQRSWAAPDDVLEPWLGEIRDVA